MTEFNWGEAIIWWICAGLITFVVGVIYAMYDNYRRGFHPIHDLPKDIHAFFWWCVILPPYMWAQFIDDFLDNPDDYL